MTTTPLGRQLAEVTAPLPVGAGVAVLREGMLLLVRRAIEPCLGHWAIPGGFAGEGEDPRACAIREVGEETGLNVEIASFVGAFYDAATARPCVFLLYEGRVSGGSLCPGDDVDAADFFAADELPSLAFPSTRYMADRLKAGVAAGAPATDAG